MGLGNRAHNQTYLTIFDGKFCRRVDEKYKPQPGEPEVTSRKNKLDKVVFEQHFDDLSNVYIRNIEKIVGDYGAQWKITLQEVDETFELTLPYNGGVPNGLFFRLPNIEIDKPVDLKLYQMKDGDKVKNYLVVYQNGQKVLPFFTREEPNGVPELETVIDKGVPKLSDTKRYLYFENMIEQNFKPVFADMKGKPLAPVHNVEAEAAEVPSVVSQSDEMDAYLKDCEQGFPGTIEEWRIEMAGPVYSSPATKTPPPPVGSAVTRTAPASPAAKTPAAPPNKPPGPKLAGTPAPVNIAQAPVSEANFADMPGATIPAGQAEQIWRNNYEQVKKLGYTGGYETFIAVCDTLAIKPGDAMLNDKGKLVPTSLPF